MARQLFEIYLDRGVGTTGDPVMQTVDLPFAYTQSQCLDEVLICWNYIIFNNLSSGRPDVVIEPEEP